MDKSVLEKLVEAATLAPSGDNLQPWLFSIDEFEGRITLYLNRAISSSPVDAAYHMAYVSLGAVIENIRQAAEYNGLRIDLSSNQPDSDAVVVIYIRGSSHQFRLNPILRKRHTNRMRYNRQPIPWNTLAHLQQHMNFPQNIRVLWLTDTRIIQKITPIVAEADRLMFSIPEVFESFSKTVHFGKRSKSSKHGMPVETLGINAFQQWSFRLAVQTPRWLMPNRLVGRISGYNAKQSLLYAAGVCIVTAPDDRRETELAVGQAVERAWLNLTRYGLAAQPMSSLYLLDHMVRQASAEIKRHLSASKVQSLLQQFRDVVPSLEADRLAFVLRFGYAPPAPARTNRLDVATVLRDGGG